MMNYCVKVCIDQLLWILSWGWYQLLFGTLFSFISYLFLGRLKIVHAFLLSLAAYGFSLGIYLLVVAGVMITYCKVNYISEPEMCVYSPLCASLLLGLIYSFLQLLLFALINHWRKFRVVYFFGLSLLCNILAAFAASSCIKINF
jgi:hypothetical protein